MSLTRAQLDHALGRMSRQIEALANAVTAQRKLHHEQVTLRHELQEQVTQFRCRTWRARWRWLLRGR